MEKVRHRADKRSTTVVRVSRTKSDFLGSQNYPKGSCGGESAEKRNIPIRETRTGAKAKKNYKIKQNETNQF
jgi:hypothetical protein